MTGFQQHDGDAVTFTPRSSKPPAPVRRYTRAVRRPRWAFNQFAVAFRVLNCAAGRRDVVEVEPLDRPARQREDLAVVAMRTPAEAGAR